MKRIILSEGKLRRLLYEYNQTRFTPTIMDMDKEFKTLNTLMYNDVLPIPRFKPTNSQQKFGEFTCQIDNSGRITNPTISISVYYQYDIQQFDSLMAHEMIHYYLAYIGHDTNCTHNAEWQQMAADFNQDYGLEITETIDTSKYTPSQQPNGGGNGNGQPNNPQNPSQQPNGGGINPQIWKQLQQISKNLTKFYEQASKEQNSLSANKQNQPQLVNASLNLLNLCPAICERIKICVKKQTLNEDFTQGNAQPTVSQVFGLKGGPMYYGKKLMHDYNKWNQILWLGKKTIYKYIDQHGKTHEDYYTLYQLVFEVYPSTKKQYSKYSTTLSQQVPTSTQIITEIDGLQQLMQQELGQNQQVQNPTNQPQGSNQNCQQHNPQQNGNNQPTP